MVSDLREISNLSVAWCGLVILILSSEEVNKANLLFWFRKSSLLHSVVNIKHAETEHNEGSEEEYNLECDISLGFEFLLLSKLRNNWSSLLFNRSVFFLSCRSTLFSWLSLLWLRIITSLNWSSFLCFDNTFRWFFLCGSWLSSLLSLWFLFSFNISVIISSGYGIRIHWNEFWLMRHLFFNLWLFFLLRFNCIWYFYDNLFCSWSSLKNAFGSLSWWLK